MDGVTSCWPINKQCTQLKSGWKSSSAPYRGQEVHTSHNFCPVSLTVIWLPSLSVQEKGTSSLSTWAPFSPFLWAPFLVLSIVKNSEQSRRATSEEEEVWRREKNVWKGMCLQGKSRGLSKQGISVHLLRCAWCHSFFLVPQPAKL